MSYKTTLRQALRLASSCYVEEVEIIHAKTTKFDDVDMVTITLADKTQIVVKDQEIEIDERGYTTVRSVHDRNHVLSFFVRTPLQPE